MSLSGLILGLINIAIVVAVLVLVGAVIVMFAKWMQWPIDWNVQRLYLLVVALIALYMVVALLLGRRRREDPLAELTPREREVLALMAEGRTNAAMAEALVVTERAVEKHVTGIFSKLGLPPAAADHRRVLAVLLFLASR